MMTRQKGGMHRKTLALVAVALVATIWLVYSQIRPTTEPGVRSPLPPRLVESPLPESAAQSKLPDNQPVSRSKASATAQSAPIRSPYRDQYFVTDSYRVFIHDALADPTRGGHFYAALAFLQCQQLTHVQIPPMQGSDSPLVLRAKEQFGKEVSKCQGVLDQYGPNPVSFWRLVRDQRNGVDPLLLPSTRGMLEPAVREYAQADFNAALRTKDPNVIAFVLASNLKYLAPDWMGKDYRQNADLVYDTASLITSCELRGICDSPLLNAGNCALANDCQYQDYRAWAADKFKDDDKAHYELALARFRKAAGL